MEPGGGNRGEHANLHGLTWALPLTTRLSPQADTMAAQGTGKGPVQEAVVGRSLDTPPLAPGRKWGKAT